MAWELLAVLSAAFNALGSLLQRRGASRAPPEHAMRVQLIGDLVHSRATVGGLVALAFGVVLQATALHGAPLTLIEPILVVELPFTLLLARLLFGARVSRRAWLAILITGGALAGLLLAAAPSGGAVAHASTLAWIAALAATAGLVALLIGAALRVDGARRAALLAIAAGAGHGLSATLMKATTAAAAHGVLSALGAWQLYGMVIAGGGSVFLYQNALQAGTLVAAQPALSIADPALSVCYGVLLFGEHVRGGAHLVAAGVCLALLLPGIVLLARSQPPQSASPFSSARESELKAHTST
jgi:drug/metabolite transporter (DMT)-like permease